VEGFRISIVDVHTHIIPRWFLDEVGSHGLFGIKLEGDELLHPDGDRYPVGPEFFDVAARISEMDRLGIDVSVLSVSPTLFFTSEPADEAVEVARRLNDALASWVSSDPRRFSAMATLPLQAPEEAAREFERAVSVLGLVGASIPTRIAQVRSIDTGELDPVFAVANEHKVPVLLHPNDPPVAQLEDYELANAVGNPLDTTIAASRLILSGTLDKFPDLRIVLVHAGGFLPYQVGRLDRIFEVRSNVGVNISKPPSSYLDRFWIDSITHSTHALAYLAQLIGPNRLVLGSDYPFDMQDPDPVAHVRDADIDPQVLGETAVELFRLGESQTGSM
jgi:aminocarboxymuconate-semialdehyde decarboxylase